MKTIFKTIAIIAITSFASCTQWGEFEPARETVGEKIEATTTIAELRANFMDTSFVFFGANRIISDSLLVINGIVTSTDAEGNIFSYIVIQEEHEGGRAIRVSIDMRDLAVTYPLGQRVAVIANGLYIGQFGQSPQIGILGRHRTRTVEPEQTAAIPPPIARLQVVPFGKLEPSAVVPDTMTIAEILAAAPNVIVHRLVHIRNVHFTGRGGWSSRPNPITHSHFEELAERDRIFAPSTNGAGFPQAREIKDDTGSLRISTSEFALFANQPLPADTIVGDITVLIGFYNNTHPELEAMREQYYQLTLRTLSDLGRGFEEYLRSIHYVPGER